MSISGPLPQSVGGISAQQPVHTPGPPAHAPPLSASIPPDLRTTRSGSRDFTPVTKEQVSQNIQQIAKNLSEVDATNEKLLEYDRKQDKELEIDSSKDHIRYETIASFLSKWGARLFKALALTALIGAIAAVCVFCPPVAAALGIATAIGGTAGLVKLGVAALAALAAAGILNKISNKLYTTHAESQRDLAAHQQTLASLEKDVKTTRQQYNEDRAKVRPIQDQMKNAAIEQIRDTKITLEEEKTKLEAAAKKKGGPEATRIAKQRLAEYNKFYDRQMKVLNELEGQAKAAYAKPSWEMSFMDQIRLQS